MGFNALRLSETKRQTQTECTSVERRLLCCLSGCESTVPRHNRMGLIIQRSAQVPKVATSASADVCKHSHESKDSSPISPMTDSESVVLRIPEKTEIQHKMYDYCLEHKDTDAASSTIARRLEEDWKKTLGEWKTSPTYLHVWSTPMHHIRPETTSPSYSWELWTLWGTCGDLASKLHFAPPSSFSPRCLKLSVNSERMTQGQIDWLKGLRGLEKVSLLLGSGGYWFLLDSIYSNAETLRYFELDAGDWPSFSFIASLRNLVTLSLRCNQGQRLLYPFTNPYVVTSTPTYNSSVRILSLAPVNYSMLKNIRVLFPSLQQLYIEQCWSLCGTKIDDLDMPDYPHLESLYVEAMLEAIADSVPSKIGPSDEAVTKIGYWPLGPKLRKIDARIRIPFSAMAIASRHIGQLAATIVDRLRLRSYRGAMDLWIVIETENDTAEWTRFSVADVERFDPEKFISGRCSYSALREARPRLK